MFPRARSELRRWELRARAIPDPELQRLALDKLRDEGVCAEGVAAFALLAVASERAAVVRFCVAFEVMYDLVDGLGEQPAPDPLANNRQLSRALVAALDPAAPLIDFYAFHPRVGDDGYLNELIAACRAVLTTLPSYPLVAEALRRAVERAGEAQSLNHSGMLAGNMRPLALWAAAQDAELALRWWEVAAAAAAPLCIYALSALAGHGDATADEASLLEATYFPWVAGLLGVLESLVDQEEDEAAGTLSYASHYASSDEAAASAALFARRSAQQMRALRQPWAHRAILAGMVATNLSHSGARDEMARRAGSEVRASIDGPVGSLLLLLRLRRQLKRLGG
ncbi:MAG: DUF2600 family protein [Conexibacter sp.]